MLAQAMSANRPPRFEDIICEEPESDDDETLCGNAVVARCLDCGKKLCPYCKVPSPHAIACSSIVNVLAKRLLGLACSSMLNGTCARRPNTIAAQQDTENDREAEIDEARSERKRGKESEREL